MWSSTGRELFYVAATGAIMAVGVDSGPAWLATPPATVVKTGYVTAANVGRNYDVSRDGRRFLMLKPAGDPDSPSELIVVQQFTEDLNRLAPIK